MAKHPKNPAKYKASARAVRLLRKRLHINQTQLAARVGVHSRQVQKWEAASALPGGDKMLLMLSMCPDEETAAAFGQKKSLTLPPAISNAQVIANFRRALGLSVEEAAKRIRVSPERWRKFEDARAEPTGPEIKRISSLTANPLETEKFFLDIYGGGFTIRAIPYNEGDSVNPDQAQALVETKPILQHIESLYVAASSGSKEALAELRELRMKYERVPSNKT